MAKIALLIGINAPEEATVPNFPMTLPMTTGDLAAMSQVLEHPEIAQVDRVMLLSEPMQEGMADAIDRLFETYKPDDLLLLYFSGYGFRDEKGNLYLISQNPQEGRSERFKASAVEAQFIQERMQMQAASCNLSSELKLSSEASLRSKIEVAKKEITDQGSQIEVNDSESSPGNTSRNASRNTSEQEYRQEVERLLYEGQLSRIAQRILQWRQRELELTDAVTQTIEADVIQTYHTYQENLKVFQDTLAEELAATGNVLNAIACEQLRRFQQVLQLREQDVAQVMAKFVPPAQTFKPQLATSSNLTSIHAAQVNAAQVQPSSSCNLSNLSIEVVTVNARGEERQRQTEQVQIFVEDLGNGITLEMVSIPGGSFRMGSPDHEKDRMSRESPQFEVMVPAFFMGRYAVTQAQYEAIANHNPSDFTGKNRPVENVSWYEAQDFCQKLSQKTGRTYRLPSESEWEYACRADTTTAFHFGATLTTDLGNYNGSFSYQTEPEGQYREQTTAVGQFLPNAFGLYDMHGNVWEWCDDIWHETYEGAPTDGSAWKEGGDRRFRPLRGGSWDFVPWYCRAATRDPFAADYRDYDVGFRVVVDL
jgi:formylglycine-generating enzyme required for sulfatase activity